MYPPGLDGSSEHASSILAKRLNIEEVEEIEQLRLHVVDDEIIVGMQLKNLTLEYASSDLMANGWDALKAFRLAYEEGRPYDFVFLALMMPGIYG